MRLRSFSWMPGPRSATPITILSPFSSAVMTMGDHQLVVDVAVESLDELRRFLTEQPWAAAVESMRSSPVLAAYKRSGIVTVES